VLLIFINFTSLIVAQTIRAVHAAYRVT